MESIAGKKIIIAVKLRCSAGKLSDGKGEKNLKLLKI